MASDANDLVPSPTTISSTAARIRRFPSTWLDDVFRRLGLRRAVRSAAAKEGAMDDLAGGRSIDAGPEIESEGRVDESAGLGRTDAGPGAKSQSPVEESAGQASAVEGPGAETQSSVEKSSGQRSTIDGPEAESSGICAKGEYLPSKQEVYRDLFFRFVLNTPQEDRPFFVRVLFNMEDAHWFYTDYLVQNNPSLKRHKEFDDFVKEMFTECAPLRPYLPHITTIFEQFNAYRYSIPVCGAAILNESYDKCLLVRGPNRHNWGFPRGKKDEDEEDHACAIREVMEETGLDITDLLDTSNYMETYNENQRIKLYKILGVKESTEFAPVTKMEISDIEWHLVNNVLNQSSRRGKGMFKGTNLFRRELEKWIHECRSRDTATLPPPPLEKVPNCVPSATSTPFYTVTHKPTSGPAKPLTTSAKPAFSANSDTRKSEENNSSYAIEDHTIFVGDLPVNTTDVRVKTMFEGYGRIKRDGVRVTKCQAENYSSAFVEFESADSAKAAIKASPLKIGDHQAYIEPKRKSTPVQKDSRDNDPSLLGPYEAPEQQHPSQPAQQQRPPEEQRSYEPPHKRRSNQVATAPRLRW